MWRRRRRWWRGMADGGEIDVGRVLMEKKLEEEEKEEDGCDGGGV